jgi:acetyltransferase-like isoleucine patch superfamily enzyme/glycosyltransferase involved in cell wall biosynthesis
MIILHVIATVNPEYGGPIEGIFTSAPVLKEHGCDLEIVSLDIPSDPWVETCPLPVYPLGIANPKYLAWRSKFSWLRYGYSPDLIPWLKKNANRYDAIVINGLWNFTSFAAWRALPQTGARYFVYPHGMLDPYFNSAFPIKSAFKQLLWWLSEGRLVNNASAVLFVSEEERILARKSFWPFRGNERVAPFGIVDPQGDPKTQVQAFRAAFPEIGDRRFILFLSRIHPKKGCDLLVEAFAGVAAKDPSLDLVIAGPDSVGWVKKLQVAASNLGIADRIHWPGMLNDDLKWGAFRAAEAFILPSHQENFGIVVTEAMACATPVLTTRAVATWREVDVYRAGLVEKDDLPGVKRLFERFIDLPAAERREMGQRGRDGYLKKFDMSAMAPQLIETLRCPGRGKILDAKDTRPLEGGPTYPLAHRLFRALWTLTWFFLASWTPPPLHPWRRFLLRLFGAKIAPTAAVYGSAKVWYPPNLEVGQFARIAPNVTVYCVEKITLQDYVIISQGANLCSAGHDVEDIHFQTVARPIAIGKHAWIAAEAFIGPGVTVGEGAVLGARGCVFRDLEPWTIYGGNPARKLKLRHVRFPDPADADNTRAGDA